MYTTDDMAKNRTSRGAPLQNCLAELAQKDPDFPAYLARGRRRAELAVKIRTLRVRAGLSQAQLAEKAGMHQPGIARIENGRSETSIDTLDKVAAALGCTLDVGLTPMRAGTVRRAARQ